MGIDRHPGLNLGSVIGPITIFFYKFQKLVHL